MIYLYPKSSIQKFADALDKYDHGASFEHKDRDFTWEYLGGMMSQEDARSAVLDVDHWEGYTTPSRMDFATHVLIRYRLLDILANVLGCDKHPERRICPKIPPPRMP